MRKLVYFGLSLVGTLGLVTLMHWNQAKADKAVDAVTTAFDRESDKKAWVDKRAQELDRFNTDYVSNLVRIQISVFDLDYSKLEERFGSDFQTFSIYTKEGYRFVATYNGMVYTWQFQPPATRQLYNGSELKDFLQSVKKNQIP